MQKHHIPKRWLDFLLFALIIGAALGISLILARVNDDNNPFAMAIFILASPMGISGGLRLPWPAHCA